MPCKIFIILLALSLLIHVALVHANLSFVFSTSIIAVSLAASGNDIVVSFGDALISLKQFSQSSFYFGSSFCPFPYLFYKGFVSPVTHLYSFNFVLFLFHICVAILIKISTV